MSSTPQHSVSVAGVVVDDQDRVLVIQRRDNGHWEPPGGVLELGETPQDGARREVREETGLDVEVVELSGVYKNVPRGVVALVFRCRLIGGARTVSDESSAVQWRTLEEVARDMVPAYAVRISDAFSVGANVRSHNGQDVLPDSSLLAKR